MPLNQMQGNVSPFMLNYVVEGGFLRKRLAHSSVLTAPTPVDDFPVVIPAGTAYVGQPAIIVDEVSKFNGTTTDASPIIATVPDFFPDMDWIELQGVIYLAGRTQVWAMSPSALTHAVAFNYTSLADNVVKKPLTYYRNRFYCGQSVNLNYSSAGAVSGTFSNFVVPLRSGTIRGLGVLTATLGTTTDQFLVIVSWTGSVLIYSGAYPGASDWGLVAAFDIFLPRGSSLTAMEVIQIPNDVLISAKWGPQVYSVRELLSQGYDSATFSLTEPLRPLFERYRTKEMSGVSDVYNIGSKTICYWPKRNSLAMVVTFAADGTSILDSWSTYTGISEGAGSILFLIDLSGNHITMHSCPNDTPAATTDYTRSQIRAEGDYLMLPGVDKAYRLFDEQSADLYEDFGTTAYSAICLFAPPNGLQYSLKKIENLFLFSNLTSSHSLSYSINKNFNTSPGTFIDYTTAKTSTELDISIISTAMEGYTFIPVIKESSTHTTPIEIYGADVSFESGGNF